MNRETLIQTLKNAVSDGHVATIVGTGISVAACGNQEVEGFRVATWKGLLQHGVKHCKDIGAVDDVTSQQLNAGIELGVLEFLTGAAEKISSRMNKQSAGTFRGWLQNTVGALKVKNRPVLDALDALPGILATLNYDGLIEAATNRQAITWLKTDKTQGVLQGTNKNAVLHLHGWFDEPESVVLGFSSYLNVKNDPHASTVLRALVISKTLLFVGCGDTVLDPNFECLIKWAKEALQDVRPRHFLLCRTSEVKDFRRKLTDAPWLQPLDYGPDYDALTPFLESLRPASIGAVPPDSRAPIGLSAELSARIDELFAELSGVALVGRAAELERLNRFLERQNGFLIVSGDAGLGKSAILAKWLGQRPSSPVVVKHAFSCRSDLTRSVLEFYRSILVALSTHWGRELVQLPASEADARNALFALLGDVRDAGAAKAAPLLLVVDGIDEAAPTDRWDSPFFPKALPEGMHVVASVRLSDTERPPGYLNNWLTQADDRMCVPALDRDAVVEWMQRIGGSLAGLANSDSALEALLRKTGGLPLYLSFLFDDFANLSAEADFTELIEKTPTGFANYVEMQFRILVDSPAGKEQRWREFFGLLVSAKAELHQTDITAILGMSNWELHEIPREIHRWVSLRDSNYAFRNDALRTAFARLDPWPPAKERLLAYSQDWPKHRRPYALRSFIPHLRDSGDRVGWFAVAADRQFLKSQEDAFPHEPLLPLQTIEEAMVAAITAGDFRSLCSLTFAHAAWMPDPWAINPLDHALSAPNRAAQQIKLVETIDPTAEPIWHLLVAWRNAVEGRTSEARRFLSQVVTAPGRTIHAGYWAQIVGAILPSLIEVDRDRALVVAFALRDTAELPRILGSILPPAEAVARTQEWANRKERSRSGWRELWRSLSARGELDAVLAATKSLRSAQDRADDLADVAQELADLGRLDQLTQCLRAIDENAETHVGEIDFMAKTRAILLALIGSIRLKNGDDEGWIDFRAAEAAIEALPRALPHWPVTLARVAVEWAKCGAPDSASDAFRRAITFVTQAPEARPIKAGTMNDVARCLWIAHRACPALRPCVLEMLRRMEDLTTGQLSSELENNLRRTIAEGFDELEDTERAWAWVRDIPNPQWRGKSLGDFVERRLVGNDPEEASELVRKFGGEHPGWGLVQIGAYYLRKEEWDRAGEVFAKCVQSGTTHGGGLDSSQTPVLLAELGRAFDELGDPILSKRCVAAAIRRAERIRNPHYVLWGLLNVAERTFSVRATDLGAKALAKATARALQRMDDPQRVSLLCFVARLQDLVARQPGQAQEALDRASAIISNLHRMDRVLGTTLRCKIAETLSRCGRREDAERLLRGVFRFAERRNTLPPEKANEIMAEAALGHARACSLDGAKRLLEFLGDARFDAANRARATIHTYSGDDGAAEMEVRQVANENERTKIRRDIGVILVGLGRVDEALTVARRIQVDRDNALPRIADKLVEGGHHQAFFELLIPATRFPNATTWMLANLVRLHPEVAPEVSRLLVEYVPGIMA